MTRTLPLKDDVMTPKVPQGAPGGPGAPGAPGAPGDPGGRRGRGAARWLWRLIALGVVAALVYFGREYLTQLHRLGDADPAWVAIIVVLYLTTRLATSEVMHHSLLILGCRISRYESFMLIMIRLYTNLLLPRVGLGTSAVYLKIRYGFRYADSLSLVLPMTAVALTCIGLTGLASLALRSHTATHTIIPIIFTTATIVGIVIIMLRVPVPQSWQGKIGKSLRRFNTSWATLGKNKSWLAYIATLQLTTIALRAIRLAASFWAMGQTVDFDGIIIASLLSDLMFMVSLVPMALGLREAVIITSATMMGVTPEAAAVAAVLDRLIVTATTIGTAQLGLWQFIRPMRDGNKT